MVVTYEDFSKYDYSGIEELNKRSVIWNKAVSQQMFGTSNLKEAQGVGRNIAMGTAFSLLGASIALETPTVIGLLGEGLAPLGTTAAVKVAGGAVAGGAVLGTGATIAAVTIPQAIKTGGQLGTVAIVTDYMTKNPFVVLGIAGALIAFLLWRKK